MNEKFFAVILAGGKGERFWPLSTSKHPKQILSLVSDKTLIEAAVERLEGVMPIENVLIVTNRDLTDAIRAALPALPPQNVIGEPVGRDTAAAIALGAAIVKTRDPRAAFCVLTADHVIGDLPVFRSTIAEMMSLALSKDVLLTIGIEPSFASTAYGYIEADASMEERDGVAFFHARRFVEKPDLEHANEYFASPHFFWNSGMFAWSVSALEAAFAKHRPELAALMSALGQAADQGRLEAALETEYAKLDKISIDYALMEKADNIVMARGAFAWDDVGSWNALENHLPKDRCGNAIRGQCETLDAEGNIVISEGRVTALIGVKDLVVVQADGVTLVCPKAKAQKVRKMVEKLRKTGRHEDLL